MRLIGEIGLNHLGDAGAAEQMLRDAAAQGLDEITFQIRESEYYDGTKPHRNGLAISDYSTLQSIAKDLDVSLGFACSDIEMVSLLAEGGAGFWKVLSKDMDDDDLIAAIVRTGKEVVCSTGMASADRIVGMLSRHASVNLIHTQLSHAVEDVNLQAIEVLRAHGRNVHFGLHAEDPEVLLPALAFRPTAMWVYIRPDNREDVPDGRHALPIGSLKAWRGRLNHLEKSLGDGTKVEMERGT